jgi:hypothetical protein
MQVILSMDYTTDLYEFEVRTECPDVRIKLGRCYYKSLDGKWRHKLSLFKFIMQVYRLDVIEQGWPGVARLF